MPPSEPEKPLTRFQAQRNLGLFAPLDYMCAVLLLMSWIGWFIVYIVVDPMLIKLSVGWAVANCFIHLVWLTVIVYRGLIFTLDLHADVGLMPEAAARIAAGYFEGRVKGSAK